MTAASPGLSVRSPQPGNGAAEEDHVVLMDPSGQPIGTHPRATVHTTDTPLHLAFSCYLLDAADRVLMTRRALTKATWPGVWTNSCCGHPRSGEPIEAAIRRRLADELGVADPAAIGDLTCVLPDFAYTATDASGLVENEVCPVYTARLLHPPGTVRPNPDEVTESTWVSWTDLTAAVRAAPFAFSPWAVRQVGRLAGSVR